MWENGIDLLVGYGDLVDRLAALVQRNVVVVDIRWEENFWVPYVALAGDSVGDKSWRPFWVTDVDNGALLFEDRRAEKAGPPFVYQLLLLLC